MGRLWQFLAILMAMFVLTTTEASSVAYRSAQPLRFKSDEIIVRFRDQAKATKSITTRKASLIRKFRHLPLHHLKLPAGTSLQDALAAYRSDPNVLYAEPNYIVRKAVLPDDGEFSSQWSLPLISAPAAWDRSTGSRGAGSVLVAVLDTGIAYYHPDLAANLWNNPGEICGDGIDNDGNGIVDDCYGANFGGFTPGDPWDDDTADSHGTHVAGIIGAAGNNGIGISGVNWAVRLMAVKFLHGPEGMGELSDALRGVEYALSKGAKVINLSFEVDEDSQALRDAVTAGEAAGALMVSAAGNTGRNLDITPVFPASIRSPSNIAVSASSRNDGRPAYSDYGRHTVELAAPGGSSTGSPDGVLSTVWLNGGSTLYRTTAGTSMAVPHVCGAAALLWNLYPSLTAAQVKARIMNGVDKLTDFSESTISGGRLNLEKAIKSADLPTVFDVTPHALPTDGGPVTISGINFGTTQGGVSVSGVPLSVTSWGDREITATIPSNTVSGTLTVNGLGSGFPVELVAPPRVELAASPATGTAALSVAFSATVTSEASIASYEWDLGDGVFRQNGSSDYLNHTFPSGGVFTIRLRVTDSTGQSGTGSTVVTVATPAGSGGGSCFIATAAYGSYLDPKVMVLRRFRDTMLLTNAPGRLFVRAYYAASPPLADFISRHSQLRAVTRCLLAPLIAVIEYPFIAAALLFATLAGIIRFTGMMNIRCLKYDSCPHRKDQ